MIDLIPLAPFPSGNPDKSGAETAPIYGGVYPPFQCQIWTESGGSAPKTGVFCDFAARFPPQFRGSVTAKTHVFTKESKVLLQKVALFRPLWRESSVHQFTR